MSDLMILDLERIDAEIGSPDENTRWQAVIELGAEGHCEYAPEIIWPLVVKWGSCADEDVRTAIGTCLLEHILDAHFDKYFEKTAHLVYGGSKEFADTFSHCWKFGNAKIPENNRRWDELDAFIEQASKSKRTISSRQISRRKRRQ
jgi:uncharacterized protein YdcH (DUF465 family)